MEKHAALGEIDRRILQEHSALAQEYANGKKAVRLMLDTFELSDGQRTVFLAIMDHLEQIRADWMLENGIPVIGAEE